jgi:putative FmdB family regulatory protein
MPIYEFMCSECSKSFEELVFSASKVDSVVCPSCGSGEVKKKMSTFASKTSGGSSFSFNASSAGSSGGACSGSV